MFYSGRVGVTYEKTLRDVDTEKGVLRYHEVGDGAPLVLLHGSGIGVNGWRNYRGNLASFAEHFHCYALEFPGFGVSDPWEGIRSSQPPTPSSASWMRWESNPLP